MEGSVRNWPLPHPPAEASAATMASDSVLLATVSTGVVHGIGLVKSPVPGTGGGGVVVPVEVGESVGVDVGDVVPVPVGEGFA